MAGASHLLSKLSRSLASIDDAALAAITSTGLLRRAKKDLEKEPISVDESNDALCIKVGGDVVTMNEAGPAAARCSCPAGSKCRHVIVATLYLQRASAAGSDGTEQQVAAGAAALETNPAAPGSAAAPGDAPSPPASANTVHDEIMGFTEQVLAKWVGRKLLREAIGLLEGTPEIEVAESGAVTIKFRALSVECRYFPGTGLEGMVTTAPSRSRERFLAAAVLAYQRRHGVVHETDQQGTTSAPSASGAPRTRTEVLESACSLLEEMVQIGTAHVSGAARDRLQTLAVSCIGANLPRLALALKTLSDQVALTLSRDAQADDVKLFGTIALAYALCQALVAAGDSAPQAFIGRHRTRYDETGTLELSGVAAYAWRTQSGYHGLTVLFWDAAAQKWCSWSDSRPRSRDRLFNPVTRYTQDLPWAGATNGWHMSRRRFKLQGASRNQENRLSASEQCRAILEDAVDPAAIDFGSTLFTDWTRLSRYLASVTPAGLEQHAPLDRVVVVRPAAWGPRVFLPAQQTLVWPLFDERGQSLVLTMPFDEVNKRAIEALERIDADTGLPWGIVGRVTFDGAEVQLWPYALFRDSGLLEARIHNLTLDGAGDPAPASEAATPETEPGEPIAAESDEESPELMTESFAAILRQWAGLEDELERLAETGTRSLVSATSERFVALARDLRDRGLDPLGDCLEPLGIARSPASLLLRTKYLCILYRDLAGRVLLDASARQSEPST